MENFTPIATAKKKNTNKLLIFGNLFLLILLVSIGGYFLRDKLFPTQQKANGSPGECNGTFYTRHQCGSWRDVQESRGDCCSNGHFRDSGKTVTCTKGDYCIATRAEKKCIDRSSSSYGDHCFISVDINCSQNERCQEQPATSTPTLPSPTATPTSTRTPTPTPTRTPTPTSIPTSTPTGTIPPSNTPTVTPTNTPGPTATNTPIPSPTEIILVVNTNTPTPSQPTNTPIQQIVQTGDVRSSLVFTLPIGIILLGFLL
jgi:hypothetical protein